MSELFKLRVYAATCKRLINYYNENKSSGERENSPFWVAQLKETRVRYAEVKRGVL